MGEKDEIVELTTTVAGKFGTALAVWAAEHATHYASAARSRIARHLAARLAVRRVRKDARKWQPGDAAFVRIEAQSPRLQVLEGGGGRLRVTLDIVPRAPFGVLLCTAHYHVSVSHIGLTQLAEWDFTCAPSRSDPTDRPFQERLELLFPPGSFAVSARSGPAVPLLVRIDGEIQIGGPWEKFALPKLPVNLSAWCLGHGLDPQN